MPYNKETEATIVVGRKYHTMLTKLADADRRKLRVMTEIVIEQAYKDYTNKST